MPKAIGGLGRGLSSLIPAKIKEETNFWESIPIDDGTLKERVIEIEPEKIALNPYQARRQFNEEELWDLANSIKEHGILQPLIVTKKDGKYELIAGERRLRAAKLINLKKVPVIVREADDLEKLELALIENIQREDLTPIELARAYEKLRDEFGLKMKELAKRVGKSRPSVNNTIRLLNLPEEIQASLDRGEINEGQAKLVLSVIDPEEQIQLWKKILEQKLNREQIGQEIRKTKVRTHYRQIHYDPNLDAQSKELEEILGTKVQITKKRTGGAIIIEFYSDEEMRGLIKRLKGA